MKNFTATGFTLIELLMTISIVAVLSTVAITQFADFGKDARAAVTKERLSALKIAIMGDSRLVSNGQYSNAGFVAHCLAPPATLDDLITRPASGVCSVVYDPFQKRGWRGPYVSSSEMSWNKDAWGTLFEYFVTGPPVRTIRSCGADLVCGNSDDLNVTF